MAGEQQRISGDKPNEPSLEGQSCGWCSEPATGFMPRMRKLKGAKAGALVETGMHLFFCDEHEDVAERSNRPLDSLRKK